jgi:hypothetical protein
MALDGVSVPYLLLKGTPLAYMYYPHASLRPRLDTDLMIRRADLPVAAHALEELGYHAPNCVRNESTMHQLSYCRTDAQGLRHTYDIHWKISNRPVVADFLTFDELYERAIGVPALGNTARTLDAVHALLLACVHRVAHHNDTDALIWLYDIHLLASSFTSSQWNEFARLATDKQVRAICARGLALAQQSFHTVVKSELQTGSVELSADCLGREIRHRHVWLWDMKALPTWHKRWQLVRDVAFPDAAYMFREYGLNSRSLLPLFYGHRFISRTWRLMRHSLQPN